MKKFSTVAFLTVCALGLSLHGFAANKDRTGQGGAPEMLINPWAQSTGVFGLNTAYVSGIEAMKNNIAGLAGVDKTEFGVSHGIYLTGTSVNISDLALAQKVGSLGVLGVNIMSMDFGDIPVTDYYNPGGYGTFHPQFLNIELGFSKQFSNSIRAGIAATYVSEQVGNIGAQGMAFEAGVQYTTGKRDNFHFGVTLRNIGTNMRFTGKGFSINGDAPQSSPAFSVTTQYPSNEYDMPTYLNIGVSYDLYLDEDHLKDANDKPKHRLTVMGDFTSNSYENDYIGAALEYSFNNMFMLRGGYRYENGITDPSTTTTMYTGLAVGATVQSRLGGSKGPMVSFDYSYRPTDRPANGVHMFSLRLSRAK